MGPLVLEMNDLTRPWMGIDPFIMCGYQFNRYPAGNDQLGINPQELDGRALGNDFSGKDGYSMYHGNTVPGFPSHPHRGFETVTIVRQGYVDHADSMGAKARYGMGDVQWLTAGAGVQHAEMFPLLYTDQPNTMELFQIWLNLPSSKKMVKPDFKMLWAEQIPHYRHGAAKVEVIAGQYRPADGSPALNPAAPPADSWGAHADADVAIWLVHLPPGASVVLPAARLAKAQRMLYVFDGSGLQIAGQAIGGRKMLRVDAQQQLPLTNTTAETVQILLLQGVPIAEPVAAAGQFVMNTMAELHQAHADYLRTRFGGWPWKDYEPTHGDRLQRFAHYPGESEPTLPPQTRDAS